MRYDDRRCSIFDGRVKYFSWMHDALIQRANADDVGIDNSAGTIDGDGDEVFAVKMMILVQILINSARCSNDRIVFDTMVTGTVLSDATLALFVPITAWFSVIDTHILSHSSSMPKG